MQHVTMRFHLCPEPASRELIGPTCALYDGPGGRGLAADEERQTDGTLVSDDRDFGRAAIDQNVEEGDDAIRREVDLAQRGAGLVHHRAARHVYPLQVRKEALAHHAGQGVEDVVLVGRRD